jgi:hypothetical protein
MIKMSMRQPKMRHTPTALRRLGQQNMPIPGRIDHCRYASQGIGKEISVGSHRPKGESEDLQHGIIFSVAAGC